MKTLTRQRGFTLGEVGIAIAVLVVLAANVGIVWAAVHFIRKWW